MRKRDLSISGAAANPFPFSIYPRGEVLSKIITWGDDEPPDPNEVMYKTSPGNLEEILRSVGLGHLTSAYQEHLDRQAERGKSGHPLVIIPARIYGKIRKHAEAAHQSRVAARGKDAMYGRTATGKLIPRGEEPEYAYDERAAALGGNAFLTDDGHTILVVRDTQLSQDPHEAGNSVIMNNYNIDKDTSDRTGIVPLGTMHSHPPSVFASQPSQGDLNTFSFRGQGKGPINLIMYPYGPETEAARPEFVSDVMHGKELILAGNSESLDASAYGKTSHTRPFFVDNDVVSDMDQRNFIVVNDNGGYASTPDNFGQGIHGLANIPGSHITTEPWANGGKSHRPRISQAFGASPSDIDPQDPIQTRAQYRTTAKSLTPFPFAIWPDN